MKTACTKNIIVGALVCALAASAAHAQDAELAKKLSNPIANLISVPFQFNYNEKIGPLENGKQSYLNVQPVIPISLNADWNVISRTILPIVNQNDIAPGTGHQFGLGDTLQSLILFAEGSWSGRHHLGGWASMPAYDPEAVMRIAGAPSGILGHQC